MIMEAVGYHRSWGQWSATAEEMGELGDAILRHPARSIYDLAVKFDALAWLHINVVDRFNDEFKIQLTWLRQSPPEVSNPGMSFPAVLRQLRTLLGTGAEQGEIRLANPAAELTARCVLELTWMPEGIVRRIGKRAALIHARDTVLRGVAVR